MDEELERAFDLGTDIVLNMCPPGIGFRKGEAPVWDIDLNEGYSDDVMDYDMWWEWNRWPSQTRFERGFWAVRRARRKLSSAAPAWLVLLHMALTKLRRDVYNYFVQWNDCCRTRYKGAQTNCLIWLYEADVLARIRDLKTK